MLRRTTLLVLVLVFSSAAFAGGLAKLGHAWQDAFDSGDADQIAGVYSHDGRLLPPHGEPVIGRDAIREYWGGLLEAGLHIQTNLEDMSEDGKLAYRTGSFEVKNADGTVIDNGRYVEIWKKRDGHWWFFIDIWNSDRPLATE